MRLEHFPIVPNAFHTAPQWLHVRPIHMLPRVYEQSLADTELSLGAVPSGCTPDTPALHSLTQPLIHILGIVGDQGTGKGCTASPETCTQLGSCCGSIRSHLRGKHYDSLKFDILSF